MSDVERGRRDSRIFADADHWNREHPDEEPIDPDPDGQLRGAHASLGRFLRTDPTREENGS